MLAPQPHNDNLGWAESSVGGPCTLCGGSGVLVIFDEVHDPVMVPCVCVEPEAA